MNAGPHRVRTFSMPLESELGLIRIGNAAGLRISALPNGSLFAIEHGDGHGRIMLNQLLGSPLGGCVVRVVLRTGSGETVEAAGPAAAVEFGSAGDRFVWAGESVGLRHRVTLWLHPTQNLWLWRLDLANLSGAPVSCDAILVQDLGLGERGFVTGNEAFASQYIDHSIAAHPRLGPIIMSRQILAQHGRHPWLAHGCLDGAASFATDAAQLFGPAYRDAAFLAFPFGTSLPGVRLQREAACAVLQSGARELAPGGETDCSFFALFDPDHSAVSGDEDLVRADAAEEAAAAFSKAEVALCAPIRSLPQDAPPLQCSAGEEAAAQGGRMHEERREGQLLSYFLEDGPRNRHAVLRDKDRLMPRRHGTILRSGRSLLPDEAVLSATCWMHGVFAAQLAIGNIGFHQLFSVSRDAFNIVRTSGLRILAETRGGWRLLTLPSIFEMGLSDCRWVYDTDGGSIAVHAAASGEDAAMQWEIAVDGEPCRFLVFGHVVLGERDYANAGRIEVDGDAKRFTFRPDPDSLWAKHYPQAVYHLVTGTPGAVEAIGGDELLYADGQPRGGPYVALRTAPTRQLRIAVVGSMTDPAEAARLAEKYEGGVAAPDMLRSADSFWSRVTRDVRLKGEGEGIRSVNTFFPWLVRDAVVHLSVPHGLEQYTGAAWGTRDVCQGPMEFLLALEHDETAKQVLKLVFGRQFTSGGWPQWFMHEPYGEIQDPHSHGDIPIWPLKALCDYIECTNDFTVLSELVPWRNNPSASSTAAHCETLLASLQEKFIPGTHLIRYGEGDWNDSLQPADPTLKDWMVSSWTVALFFQQLRRYAGILRGAGEADHASRLDELAGAMRTDFNRHLLRDGTVAGYAIFNREGGVSELLLHPSDQKTGVRYSLIAMNCAIAGGLFTPEQARHHLGLIRANLSFPDGVRLMDRPVPYRGGAEHIFRRAESSPYFGREVGLMYVHAHLRYCEAAAAMGEAQDFWEGLQTVNPIAVTERLPHAGLRQRNCSFTSSDAAFDDRYEASAQWERVRQGSVTADGGWRIYSSSPGLYIQLLLAQLAGRRRRFGETLASPLAREGEQAVTLEWLMQREAVSRP
ncbi:MAG: GH36-type glycosyl hydrolase domain-containing protein [Rhodomicrobium sp.]